MMKAATPHFRFTGNFGLRGRIPGDHEQCQCRPRGSSGAQVALVTKSGTNDFTVQREYLRNTYTSANDYFVKVGRKLARARAMEHL